MLEDFNWKKQEKLVLLVIVKFYWDIVMIFYFLPGFLLLTFLMS